MDVQSALERAQGALDAGRFDEAIDELTRCAKRHASFPDVHHQLGVALSLAGQGLRAEAYFHRAIELNPQYAEAHLNLSILLFERGAYAAAREHLRRFNRVTSGNARGCPDVVLDDLAKRHAALAEQYRNYGLLSDAEEELRKALSLRPEYCDLRVQLAQVLFERSKLAESATHLDAVLQLRPHYDAALLLRGRIQQERGDFEAARETWMQVRDGSHAIQARALMDRLRGRRPAARLERDPPRDLAEGGS